MNQQVILKIAPSILASDFGCLLSEVKKIEREADALHFDVMDGHFVPNITFGPGLVRALRKEVKLPFDVHLMVDNPEEWIEPFVRVGCEFITVHLEVALHLDRLISFIKDRGVKAGVALNPTTSLYNLEYILSKLDLVLLMTVNPGFGAQRFIPEVLPKIKNLREMAEKRGIQLDIAVDGGINGETAEKVVKAGANFLIMGTSIFETSDPEKAILDIREKLRIKFNLKKKGGLLSVSTNST